MALKGWKVEESFIKGLFQRGKRGLEEGRTPSLQVQGEGKVSATKRHELYGQGPLRGLPSLGQGAAAPGRRAREWREHPSHTYWPTVPPTGGMEPCWCSP